MELIKGGIYTDKYGYTNILICENDTKYFITTIDTTLETKILNEPLMKHNIMIYLKQLILFPNLIQFSAIDKSSLQFEDNIDGYLGEVSIDIRNKCIDLLIKKDLNEL